MLHEGPIPTLASPLHPRHSADTIPPTRRSPVFVPLRDEACGDEDDVPTIANPLRPLAPLSVTLPGLGFRIAPFALAHDAPATVRDPAPLFQG